MPSSSVLEAIMDPLTSSLHTGLTGKLVMDHFVLPHKIEKSPFLFTA